MEKISQNINKLKQELHKIHISYCRKRNLLIKDIKIEIGLDDFIPLANFMDEDILDFLYKNNKPTWFLMFCYQQEFDRKTKEVQSIIEKIKTS